MQLIPVQSTTIQAVGYENGLLVIAFHSGESYSYQGVSELVYHAFITAPSIGSFYVRSIKGKYPAVRIS